MADNKFLVFNSNAANMQSDAEYVAETQRLNGVVNGIAKANMHNKLFHQMSTLAAAIGELVKAAGYDASDADLATLVSNISNSFALKPYVDSELAAKATQEALDATNLALSQTVKKDEITNGSYPLDVSSWTYLYANLPTASVDNKSGYLYCTDGDGTHGAGNYVSNGTSWYFGGTGDQGYNILKNDTDKFDDYTSNLIGNIVEENLYKGSAEWRGTWISEATTWQDVAEKIKGFKVKKKTGTWQGLFKLINVVAGKTYTFSVWVKASVAQNVSVMNNQTLSGYVTTATVTKHAIQFALVADTWTKITLTFNCTVSGTIAPRIENTTSADFYVAGYKLVEGTESFELSEFVNDIQDISDIKTAVDDIAMPHINLLDTVTKTTGKICNRGTLNIADNVNASIYGLILIKSGTTYYYKMLYAYFSTIKYASGTLVSLSDNTNSDAYGSFTAAEDGIIAISVSNVRNNYLFTDSEELYNSEFVKSYYRPDKLLLPRTYYVEKDGSGDFTKLTDAITEACKYMDSTVYVGAGTWDIIDELGETYLNSVSTSQRGPVYKNRVHVIFSSQALMTCHYTGTRADTITWLSPINAGAYGFTLKNARIRSSKCRYSVHDERSTDTDHYKNHYINCYMYHDNTDGGNRQCIGGGLGTDGHVRIEGCIFENPTANNNSLVSYHNSWGSGGSFVEAKDNYVKGTGTMRFSWFGPSTDITTVMATNNNIGSAIQFVQETTDTSVGVPIDIENMELIEWNNIVRP